MLDKASEVRRLLDRYMVEIVETYDLCPWARPARIGGELAVEILWDTPTPEHWFEAAQRLLARPEMRVAMIIAPELAGPPSVLREARDQLVPRITSAGIAHFHPDAELDLATPARLVPYLRRSPDPLLQLVPLAYLDAVRAPPPAMSREQQAQVLRGIDVEPARMDAGDRIAEANHTRVTADQKSIEARLADIAADRRRSYERVGIAINTGR